ncbi:MAG: ABC transporter permease [Rhodanobacter sp.]
MFAYYLNLAIRSLKRNKVLTALMILALALGIGASITTLTVVGVLARDPLPQKSAQLFHPQIDPLPKEGYVPGQTRPQADFTYTDAMNLLKAHKAERQAAVATLPVKIMSQHEGNRPFFSSGALITTDFFPMFDVPFQYGSGWSAEDDDGRANVAVIADFINDKLFGGTNSVGKTIRINDHDFRIIGVLKRWAPQPRFYAAELDGRSYGDGDAVFVPLQTALADGMNTPNIGCFTDGDQRNLETAPCTWLGVWVELADDAAVANYKNYLSNYVHEQIALGRFYRTDIALPDLMWLMHMEQVVPDTVRLKAGLSVGFLLICILNTVGLLLAKCLRRAQEIGVRRALGATRGAIFAQFMVEAAIIGLAGGVLGLLFAELGLWATRHQSSAYANLARLNIHMFLLTFVVALVASLAAGLLPAWRASGLAPAPQLKAG